MILICNVKIFANYWLREIAKDTWPHLEHIEWWWQVFEASIWVVLGCNFMGNRIHGISDHSVLYWMGSCEADGKFADKLWKNGGYENPGRKCTQGQKWISHNSFPRNPNSNEWCIRYKLIYDIHFTYFLDVSQLLPLWEADGWLLLCINSDPLDAILDVSRMELKKTKLQVC